LIKKFFEILKQTRKDNKNTSKEKLQYISSKIHQKENYRTYLLKNTSKGKLQYISSKIHQKENYRTYLLKNTSKGKLQNISSKKYIKRKITEHIF
jgi:hypothetical protein